MDYIGNILFAIGMLLAFPPIVGKLSGAEFTDDHPILSILCSIIGVIICFCGICML